MSNLNSIGVAQPPVPRPQDLSALNTFGLQSRASAFVRLDDEAQLPQLAALIEHYDAHLVLGGGSNVVLPADVPGLVIHMALKGIRHVRDDAGVRIIEAAAGENWHAFVAHCIQNGWDGLENLALIPGQVGASPVQNIGAYGIELADRLHAVRAWDRDARQVVTLSAAACELAYRDSRFKREVGRWLILSVQFALPVMWQARLDYPDLQRRPEWQDGRRATPRQVFDAVCDIRRNKLPDPEVIGNAGSFFKNPIVDAARHDALKARFPGLVSYPMADGAFKLAAGWLIDQCGWKGRALGRAAVHDRQALVLTNLGGANANDIMALARAIQADVLTRYGVALTPEPLVV